MQLRREKIFSHYPHEKIEPDAILSTSHQIPVGLKYTLYFGTRRWEWEDNLCSNARRMTSLFHPNPRFIQTEAAIDAIKIRFSLVALS
jgi:hypothetical protein